MYVLRQYTLPLMLAVLLHGAAVWALYQGFSPEQSLQSFAKPPPAVMADLIVLQPVSPKPNPRHPSQHRHPNLQKANPNPTQRPNGANRKRKPSVRRQNWRPNAKLKKKHGKRKQRQSD